MAERKQVNKYYPPDFDPRKHKNLDKYHNTHALRERAKKIDQGILVIRFEMPYHIWCEGCKIHIAMGVRYNAEKRKVGYYYSTPIYRFRMKCHLCDNYFEIETDPKDCNYKIIIGAQRKNEKWDMAENEQVLTEDRQVVKQLAADAMFKLEHGVEDKKKLQKAAPTLSDIVDIQSGWEDDYMQNRMLREKFRKEKKEKKLEESKDRALLVKSSLEIVLLPETEEDKKLASLLKYRSVESFDEKQQKKRTEIKNQSIFTKPPDSKLSPGKLVDEKTLKLNKLNKQLELAKPSNPAGFSIFDDDTRKRRMKAVSGVIVKKRRSDAKRVDVMIEDKDGVDAAEKDGSTASNDLSSSYHRNDDNERLTASKDLSSSYHRNDENERLNASKDLSSTYQINDKDDRLTGSTDLSSYHRIDENHRLTASRHLSSYHRNDENERLTTSNDSLSSHCRNDEDGTIHRKNDDDFQRTLHHPDHLSSSFSNSDSLNLKLATPSDSDILTGRIKHSNFGHSGTKNVIVNKSSAKVELPDGQDNGKGVKTIKEEAPRDISRQNGNMSLVGDYVTSSSDSD